jgi:hypothetical protein
VGEELETEILEFFLRLLLQKGKEIGSWWETKLL